MSAVGFLIEILEQEIVDLQLDFHSARDIFKTTIAEKNEMVREATI